MGYSPMIKVLSNETLMDQSARSVIHDVDPQLRLHQLHRHHRVRDERLEVLPVGQN